MGVEVAVMKVANFALFPQCAFKCLRPVGYCTLPGTYAYIYTLCGHHAFVASTGGDRPIWSGPVFGTLPAAASTPRMVPR